MPPNRLPKSGSLPLRRDGAAMALCCARHACPRTDLRPLLSQLMPVVLVNRDAGSESTPVVAADYRAGLGELLDLLYGDGHRSLVYLAGAPQSASNVQRLAAVREFLR